MGSEHAQNLIAGQLSLFDQSSSPLENPIHRACLYWAWLGVGSNNQRPDPGEPPRMLGSRATGDSSLPRYVLPPSPRLHCGTGPPGSCAPSLPAPAEPLLGHIRPGAGREQDGRRELLLEGEVGHAPQCSEFLPRGICRASTCTWHWVRPWRLASVCSCPHSALMGLWKLHGALSPDPGSHALLPGGGRCLPCRPLPTSPSGTSGLIVKAWFPLPVLGLPPSLHQPPSSTWFRPAYASQKSEYLVTNKHRHSFRTWLSDRTTTNLSVNKTLLLIVELGGRMTLP